MKYLQLQLLPITHDMPVKRSISVYDWNQPKAIKKKKKERRYVGEKEVINSPLFIQIADKLFET